MKQQRLESTYFMKVILSRDRRVSTAAKMSAWRAREWFLLSDSRLRGMTEQIINVTPLVIFSQCFYKCKLPDRFLIPSQIKKKDVWTHKAVIDYWDFFDCAQQPPLSLPPNARKPIIQTVNSFSFICFLPDKNMVSYFILTLAAGLWLVFDRGCDNAPLWGNLGWAYVDKSCPCAYIPKKDNRYSATIFCPPWT